jgi:hypothetical protein
MIVALLFNKLVVVNVCCRVFFFRLHELTISVFLAIVASSFMMVVVVVVAVAL